MIEGLARSLFRAHVVWSAEYHSIAGESAGASDLRQAKVEHLDDGLIAFDTRHVNVVRLEVSMDDSRGMCRPQPLCHGLGDLQDIGGTEGPTLANHLAERAALEQLHDEE